MDQSPPPYSTPPKKGLSGLAIAGIGCGGLFLIILIVACLFLAKACSKVKEFASDFNKNPAKAAAMLALKGNPELEIVKTDDAKGEVTIHNNKTGEDVTMSFDALAKGKFSMKTSNGDEMTVDGKNGMVIKGKDGTTVIGGDATSSTPPSWVLLYPGATATAGGMRIEKEDAINGSFVSETKDSVATVKEFYDAKLKDQGFKTETMIMNNDGKDTASVSGTKDDGKRKLTATINSSDGKTTLILIYEGPKN